MSSTEAPGVFRATGRRKNAVAVVRVKAGEGKFEINKKDARHYLCRDTLMMVVQLMVFRILLFILLQQVYLMR